MLKSDGLTGRVFVFVLSLSSIIIVIIMDAVGWEVTGVVLMVVAVGVVVVAVVVVVDR